VQTFPDGFVAHASAGLKQQTVMLGIDYLIANDTSKFESVSASSQKSFDGVYVGISVGVAGIHGDLDTHASAKSKRPLDEDVIETYHNVMQVDGHRDQAIGRIDIGYGRTLNSNFYAGIELGVSSAKRRISGAVSAPYDGSDIIAPRTTTKIFDTNISADAQNSEFTADFRPGLVLNDHALLYGRIGAAVNWIQMNSTTSFLRGERLLDEQTLTAVKGATHDDYARAALRLGVGLSYLVSKHFAVNLDYTYTDYGRLRATATKDTVTEEFDDGEFEDSTTFPNGFVAHTTVRLKQQTVMFGVDYMIG